MIEKFIIILFIPHFTGSQVTTPPSSLTTQNPDISSSTSKQPHSYQPSDISQNLTSLYVATQEQPQNLITQGCPSNYSCSDMSASCLDCSYNLSCIYGHKTISECRPVTNVECLGKRVFNISHDCLYCYQTTLHIDHTCVLQISSRNNGYPPHNYIANCSVHPEIFCLGRRSFKRMRMFKWTSGKRWRTALVLSVTLGGIGVDRFYLGHWKEGLGKLFSFGGVGVWTLVDVLLVATGYLTPADGSMYI